MLERALAEEMTGHLGYDKHDPAGRGSGNNRNGTTPKTVLTDVGAVDLAVPRDRNGTFEPQIVRKGQTRLDGFNDRIIALYARGMTTRDIRAHLREMYDVDVSPDLISRVTDAVLEELAEWQSRPLDRVYPVIFIDALMVKIRDGVVANRPVYLAIGIDCEGAKQVLGLWVGPSTGESAKFWLSRAVRAQVPRRRRRVHRVLRRADRPARRDRRGLAAGGRAAVRGAPDPRLAAVRLQQVLGAADPGPAADLHRRRRDRRGGRAGGLRRSWEDRYPAIVRLWRAHWEQFTPFLAFPPEVRRVIYTTNLIESMNARLRKVTRNRGQFPSEQAALKVLYLAVRNLEDFRSPNTGIRSSGWKQALQAFTIYFDGRIPTP